MHDVVELRVHGVGGGSPESLLGVASPETVRVAGEGPTGFWARRSQRRVEGYWWGRLTSAPVLQPLWIILLPFTLLNLAGWMHQPLRDRTKPTSGWWAVRYLLWLLGYLLTGVYAAWTGVLVVDLVIVRWWLNGRVTSVALASAAAAAVLAVAVLYLIARHVQGGYEGKRPPRPIAKSAEANSVSKGATGARFAGERDLAAPSFWKHGRGVGLLLVTHSLLALAVILGPIARSGLRLASGAPGSDTALRYDVVVSWVLRATVVTLVVLAVLTVIERVAFDRDKRRSSALYDGTEHSGFRWCGQAVAATVAVALAIGGLSGVERLLRTRIASDGSPYQDLDVAFGVAAIVFAAMVSWRLAEHWRVQRRIFAELGGGTAQRAPNDEEPQRRQISEPMRRRTAWARSMSEALRNIDLVLSIPALFFLVAAVLALFGFSLRPLWQERIAALGNTIIFMGMSTILVFLWREGRRTARRRQVGIIWDVLTFWPRRIHPWAIRPYAERAVPELQERLCSHITRDRGLILSAHSQGTVIAVAALAQFMPASGTDDPDRDVLRHIALVTYGSPIAQLYERFFPAYFHRTLTRGLGDRLFDDGIAPAASWRNFYRETDYIGKALFAGDDAVDRVLDDPALQPDIDDLALADVVADSPDPVREAFAMLALHSDYNGEAQLREWVEHVGRRIGGSPDEPSKADRCTRVPDHRHTMATTA